MSEPQSLLYQKTTPSPPPAIPSSADPNRRVKLAELHKRRVASRPQAELATRIGRRHLDEPDHPCWPAVWYAISEFVAANCAIRDLKYEETIQA